MAEKNGFDITKLIFSKQECVAVWCSGQGVAGAGFDSRRRYFLFLCIVFFLFLFLFLFSLCFLVLFFLLACFCLFALLTLLIMHLDEYIF